MHLLYALSTAALAAMVLGACASSTKSTNTPAAAAALDAQLAAQPLDSELAALAPQFAITPIEGRRYSISFVLGAGSPEGIAAVRRIESFSAVIYDTTRTRIDSLATTDINTSGTFNTETQRPSIAAYGGLEWTAEQPLRPGSFAILRLTTTRGVCWRSVGIDAPTESVSPASPISMALDISPVENVMEFVLHVRRLAPPRDGEYLPSSEQVRIEILNNVGQRIWSSSDGMNYAQMIGAVQPATVGTSIDYRAEWNGLDEVAHGLAKPGTYKAIATIPAKPSPYVIRKEFNWRGR